MEDLKKKSFSDLKDIYSDKYIHLLELISKQYDLSFEDIYMRLPSPDLVKRDEEFVETYPVARVLMGVADPASHVLTSYQVFGSVPEDYPEQPTYYISTSEGRIKAPFTKTEFLESVQEEKTKKLIRKK